MHLKFETRPFLFLPQERGEVKVVKANLIKMLIINSDLQHERGAGKIGHGAIKKVFDKKSKHYEISRCRIFNEMCSLKLP
jgi:hypothetical protein